MGQRAEVARNQPNVRLHLKNGPMTDIAAGQFRAASCHEQSQQGSPYSIALVGACLQRGRHLDANYLRRLAIDDQFILGRCLDRQIGRLFALEGAVDVADCAPILVEDIRPAEIRPPLVGKYRDA
jgi:hypothetical protein